MLWFIQGNGETERERERDRDGVGEFLIEFPNPRAWRGRCNAAWGGGCLQQLVLVQENFGQMECLCSEFQGYEISGFQKKSHMPHTRAATLEGNGSRTRRSGRR